MDYVAAIQQHNKTTVRHCSTFALPLFAYGLKDGLGTHPRTSIKSRVLCFGPSLEHKSCTKNAPRTHLEHLKSPYLLGGAFLDFSWNIVLRVFVFQSLWVHP